MYPPFVQTTTSSRVMPPLEIVVRERDESTFIPGCGMLVVNPPWRFDDEARTMLNWLQGKLAIAGRGESRVEWLVPE